MHPVSVYTIPGADLPARPPKAAQIQRIRAAVSASEAVVDLLADLAFGPRPEWGWPPASRQQQIAEACL